MLFMVSLFKCAVDACSVMQYEAKCKQCVNSFVDGLREDSTRNCSLKYISLRKCISSERKQCLESPGMTNKTAMFIRQRSIIYTANEAFFCEDGMLDTLKNYKRSSLEMCKNKFFRKTTKCLSRFRKYFNRRSGSLCRRYYKAKRCMISAFERNCKKTPFVSLLISNYKQPYNPYCRTRRDPIRTQRSSKGFGTCTQKSYVTRSRECIKDFIHTIQRNEGARCRSTVDSKLIPCIKKITKRCLRRTRDAKTLERDINRAFDAQRAYTQNLYCEGGYLETLPLAKGQCSEEYFETFQRRCNSEFIAKYRENKASPLLCQEYAKVKRCARNMTLSLCTLDDGMVDTVHFAYGDFNPFCYNGKDPEKIAIGSRGTHDRQTASTKNKACSVHTWSITALVTVIAFNFILRQN